MYKRQRKAPAPELEPVPEPKKVEEEEETLEDVPDVGETWFPANTFRKAARAAKAAAALGRKAPAPAPAPEPAPEPEGADASAAADAAAASAAAPVVAPAVPVAAKMPPARPFTKENLAPADPGESLFAKKTPVHAYLAQHIQVAVRHALRALSAQRPEEPFVMASDVIRKWTPQSAPPRLSRPGQGPAAFRGWRPSSARSACSPRRASAYISSFSRYPMRHSLLVRDPPSPPTVRARPGSRHQA